MHEWSFIAVLRPRSPLQIIAGRSLNPSLAVLGLVKHTTFTLPPFTPAGQWIGLVRE